MQPKIETHEDIEYILMVEELKLELENLQIEKQKLIAHRDIQSAKIQTLYAELNKLKDIIIRLLKK